ncbi:MAG: hypothetical protein A2748_03680 [Candidatus Wildermuthbacteria bacterium RIFCSPHIGHO2_01_FULL_45_20]|uniref:POTRA domain-containing protein n=1 Tax=Candidatus Wildermuthbacteria bacterium RIFCSPHIGHO2_02_FULL_45_25 TaxID=1802450 RepID=A0A1G2R4T1_9BACT|nr:MAG: hypothetical protein A2748_03680 [Candidatus Wildermuthbacteria bacterium RIFCSPHIGHO2_01_FULL_45_20]OHA67737.1 MAG: hypothetical protein A3C04_00420 [Candidatus Wildermuthbacteria bacterium RIFCSPHIGHO2_02_FULL_45_25]
MARKRYIKSKKAKPKHALLKKIARSKVFLIAASALGIAILLIGFFAFSPIFQIQNIHIDGAQSVLSDDLLRIAQQKIGRSFGAMQINNIFWADLSSVAHAMALSNPKIASVAISRKLPHSLSIQVVERYPAGIWCRQDGQCFFLDTEGIAYENTERDVGRLIVEDADEALPVRLGAQAIAKDRLDILLIVYRQLQQVFVLHEEHLGIEKIVLKNSSKGDIHTTEGWSVYMDLYEKVDWQIEKLVLVLKEQIPQKKRSQLEYIDLRFGDQAYVKYK